MKKSFYCFSKASAVIALAALLLVSPEAHAAGPLPDAPAEVADSVDYTDKLEPCIKARLDMVSDDDIVPVWLWLRDVPDHEIDRMVFEETGFSNQLLVENNLQNWDARMKEEHDKYSEASLAIVRREATAINQAFIQDNLSGTEGWKLFYEGTYTTTLIVCAKKSTIMDMLSDDRLLDVSLYGMDPNDVQNVIPSPDGGYLDPQVRADYVRMRQDSQEGGIIQYLIETDAVINKYYGNYQGYEVMLIGMFDDAYTDDLVDFPVGSSVFTFGSGCDPSHFYAWKDGEFILVKDAYEAGLLTDESIKKIHYVHTGGWKNPFSDVQDTAWYYDSVRYANENSLMVGRGGDLFDPEGTMTRAMAVTVLWRHAGEPAGYANIFSDVPEDTWYTQAVAWAAGEGIVQGVGNGCFAPDDKVTREQLAAILFRFAKSSGIDMGGLDGQKMVRALGSYEDAEAVGTWAEDAMGWATVNSLIQGIATGEGRRCLDPDGDATRAQVATILMRYIQNVEQK